MSRVWKVALWTLWIAGAFIVLYAIVVFYAVAFVSGFWLHTGDQSALKAIKTESQILMASEPTKTKDYLDIPKSRWPRTIASLKPAWVTVWPDRGVDIQIAPFFDGGWGYFVPQRGQEPFRPGCSELDQGVQWCHPY
jgi:hypothetical protein